MNHTPTPVGVDLSTGIEAKLRASNADLLAALQFCRARLLDRMIPACAADRDAIEQASAALAEAHG